MPDTPAESLLSATRLAQVAAAVPAKAQLAPVVGEIERHDPTPREARVQYVVDKSGDAFQQATQFSYNWITSADSAGEPDEPAASGPDDAAGLEGSGGQVAGYRLIVDSDRPLVDEPLRIAGARRHAGPRKDVAEPLAR